MPIRTLTHERVGRVLAGLTVLAGFGLGLLNAWFFLIVAGTAINLVLSGVTDRCVVKNLLIRMGFPGERDVGRAEVLPPEPVSEPLTFHRRVWHSRHPVN
ncbi:MAG TPA: DUF2892 domain-containing protein [Planctomycetota bacterium]|nr:DUF2892 domain-containing protein [Planctomycetota bacterium]